MSSLVEARLTARLLAALSAEQLAAALAQKICRNIDDRNATDAMLAERQPVPEWVVAGVLTSEDLMPHVCALLAFDDVQAPCVCKEWAKAWKATDAKRRGLLAADDTGPWMAVRLSGFSTLRLR